MKNLLAELGFREGDDRVWNVLAKQLRLVEGEVESGAFVPAVRVSSLDYARHEPGPGG